jgi:hypothetical protein
MSSVDRITWSHLGRRIRCLTELSLIIGKSTKNLEKSCTTRPDKTVAIGARPISKNAVGEANPKGHRRGNRDPAEVALTRLDSSISDPLDLCGAPRMTYGRDQLAAKEPLRR